MAVRPILILSILCMGYVMTNKLAPRGLRNNNPLNIKQFNQNWRGEVGDDGVFVIFKNMVYGYRAAARILRSYRSRGLTTITEIIEAWAPSSENDTHAYIEYVVSYISVQSGLEVDPEKNLDIKNVPYLLAAMTVVENGAIDVSMDDILKGVNAERVDFYA